MMFDMTSFGFGVSYTTGWPRVSGGSEAVVKRYSPLLGGIRDSSLGSRVAVLGGDTRSRDPC